MPAAAKPLHGPGPMAQRAPLLGRGRRAARRRSLASLPDGHWPQITDVRLSGDPSAVAAAGGLTVLSQAARLCPRLRSLAAPSGCCEALVLLAHPRCAALKHLTFDQWRGCAGSGGCRSSSAGGGHPSQQGVGAATPAADAAVAAAAAQGLSQMTRLRSLSLSSTLCNAAVSGGAGAAPISKLCAALTALTRLTRLGLACAGAACAPALAAALAAGGGGWAAALRDLHLAVPVAEMAGMGALLRGAQLQGVTKLLMTPW